MAERRASRPEVRSLVLAPDLARLIHARDFVTTIAQQAGFDETRVFDIALLTSEAAANAIEHAPVKGQVCVRTRLFADRLEVEVEGPGEFQTPDRSKRERRSRGLGLPLMAKLSDHLALYSAQEGGTLLTLTFYRRGHTRKASPLPPTVLEMFETSDRLEAVFEAMPEGFSIFDEDFRCVYVNEAMAAHDGRPRADLLGADLHVMSGGGKVLLELFEQAKSRGAEVTREVGHPMRDQWYELSVIPFAGGYAMFSRDVTERRRRGEELRQRSRLLDLSDEAILAWEPDGAIRYWNAGAERLYGFTRHEAVGSSRHELLATVFPRSLEEVLERLRREGNWYGELVHRHRDGHEVVVDSHQQLIDAHGTPLILETNRDITETKRARAAEERLRALLDHNPSLVFLKDEDGLYAYMNDSYESQFARSKDWLGKTDFDFWPAESAQLFRADDAEVLASGKAQQFLEDATDLEGRRHCWLCYKFPFTDAQGRAYVGGIGIDATARIEAEEALRESEERFRILAHENERLFRQQLDIAERLQLALLNIPSEIGRVRVGHLYRSATEAARVGGDFYDVFEVKGGLVGVLVGDVAGHGIEAARTATLVKDVVHAFAHQSAKPQEVLRRTNGLLVEKDLPGFVTLFLGILDSDTGQFNYASAGHPSTFLRRAGGEIQILGAGSAPLGVHPEATWRSGSVDLQAGDLLLLYTDGVIEARRNGEYFGEKRLQTLLRRKRISVERLPHLVLDQVLAFSGGGLKDDVAVLALSLTGGGPAKADAGFVQGSLIA